jgi:O-methyltransferase
MRPVKSILRRAFGLLGYEVVRRRAPQPEDAVPQLEDGLPKYAVPEDFTIEDRELVNVVRPYTMTSPERIYALAQAVRYVVRHQIQGDIVECGVWRGGSMMVVARVLLELGAVGRHLYLFDTFEGMTPPTEKDVVHSGGHSGRSAADLLAKEKKQVQTSLWCYSPIDDVRKNLYQTGYNPEKVHFIKGPIEETIPGEAPGLISLLRLDTDWYESTRHELVHLLPRLSPGGVLIIDDYGWWRGARQATDEYLEQHNLKLLLNRIDHTGRIAVEP